MSSLLIGKCVSTLKRNTIKLLVPQMKFDSFLSKYFRENVTILAHDQDNACNPGDWVLLKKFDEQFRLGIDYRVQKIIFKGGCIIDPISNEQVLGYYNIKDFQHLKDIFQNKIN